MKILPNIQVPNRHLSTDPLYSEIAECYDYAALENTLLGSLARDIGADTSALMHFQKNTDGYTIGHHQAHGVGNDIHSQYVKKFHRSDPVILNRISTSRTTAPIDALTDVYRLSDVCNSKDFVKTGYYNEFLKPSGIRHVLALAVRPQTQTNDLMVVIGFHRPIGARDFGETALRKAISIAPIVGSTIARLTFKKNLARYQLLSENLQTILGDSGYIILDGALQIHEISSNVTSGTFGDLPFLMSHISQTIQTLNSKSRNQVNINRITPHAKHALFCDSINLDIQRNKSKSGKLRFTVRLGFVHTNIAIAKCSELFGWTSRESEIVVALAQGLSNAEISNNLMISIRTVENHLRSVYVKAEVTSRTQLLRQLLTYTPTNHISG